MRYYGSFFDLPTTASFALFDAGFALPEGLRERVRVTRVTKGADGERSRVFSSDEVQLITDTVGQLHVRTKSVPNLNRLANAGTALEATSGVSKRPVLEGRKSCTAVPKSS